MAKRRESSSEDRREGDASISKEDRKIILEARKRFKRVQDWEMEARAHDLDDTKFANGDSYNMYQWPDNVRNMRSDRPMLTLNRTRQHNLDILNDARQSKVSIQVKPLRGGASFESALVIEGLIRHIEYISKANSAYQHALDGAVTGGIGWVRLVTDYEGEDSFDQEIYIRKVDDHLSVYLDPDINETDGSDANWGFVADDMPRDEFDRAYPAFKDIGHDSSLGMENSWVMEHHVRVAEYFRRVPREDKLLAFADPETGAQRIEKASRLEKELLASVIDDPTTKVRNIVYHRVEWFMIVGDRIVERKDWPGSYIPLCRCIGEETVIDGTLDRRGHTRALIDMQRSVNYNISAFIEFGALQTMVPFMAPVESIEGYEKNWENANIERPAVLPWKSRDDEGNENKPPTRIEPPVAAPVFVQGFRDAVEQMYLASGQNQADFGQNGNEKSGVAIENRQRQGDNATYHYLDHQSMMIQNVGRQIVDLFPHVYDTPRMRMMRDESGQESSVLIDPNAPQPFVQQTEPGNTDDQSVVFNPTMGAHDVVVEIGKAYSTQREEAADFYERILSSDKDLIHVIGDIAFGVLDIPGAEEVAKRLHRLVPPQALHDGPSPDEVTMKKQLDTSAVLITKLQDELKSKEADHLNDQEENAIRAYDAQTKRLGAISDVFSLDVEGMRVLLREVITEALHTSSTPSLKAAEDGIPYLATSGDVQAPPPLQPGAPPQALEAPAPQPPPQPGSAPQAAPGGTPAG